MKESSENKLLYTKEVNAFNLMKFAEKHAGIKFKLPEHPHLP